MPPVSEADRSARKAYSAHCSDNGGPGAVAADLDIDPRTSERIARGKRDVPPGIARRLADLVREGKPDRARMLDAWAAECAARAKETRDHG